MNFLSLDIETGGLDPKIHSVLEIGLVNQHEEWRRIILINRKQYIITPYCAHMHVNLLREINDIMCREWAYNCILIINRNTVAVDVTDIYVSNLAEAFFKAVKELIKPDSEGKITLAGKNLGFDLSFLKELGIVTEGIFQHRWLDPSILYYEPGDEVLPSTETCMRRAGLRHVIAHTAVDDAMDVVRLLKIKLNLLCEKEVSCFNK
jgi:oligoribonuclease (3'-5' exoribonuclease)